MADSSSSSTVKAAALVGGALVLSAVAAALILRKPAAAAASASASPTSTEDKKEALADDSSPKPSLLRRLSKDVEVKRQLAVVVVDPVSTGANLCDVILRRKIPCIRVWSSFVPQNLASMVAKGLLSDFAHTVFDDEADFAKTVSQIKALPYTIQAVMAGSELAIELSDKLADALGCRSNGAETSFLRRDKFQMGQAVFRSHTRAVKQARVKSWTQVEAFLEQFGSDPFKVVVPEPLAPSAEAKELKQQKFQIVIKPIRSAGSDSVYLCDTKEELKLRLEQIVGKVNKMGMANYAAVVQEYLEGNEYVVDTVSRDGVHMLSAIWVYVKLPANGAKFVYFGMRSVDPKSEIGVTLFEYMKRVLDALGIQHGPGHGEVILTETGPCLVECGARPHGAEGTFIPLAQACFGRDQVTMTADAYTDHKKFQTYAETPELLRHAFKVDLVSYVRGTLRRYQGLEQIQRMESFIRCDMMPEPGEDIPLTIDCFTAVGSISLIHKDIAVVDRDAAAIRALEKDLFEVDGASSSSSSSSSTTKLTV